MSRSDQGRLTWVFRSVASRTLGRVRQAFGQPIEPRLIIGLQLDQFGPDITPALPWPLHT